MEDSSPGTTPNYKLYGWKTHEIDFGWRSINDSIRFTHVNVLDVMSEAWGISKSEGRRRLKQGNVLCDHEVVIAANVGIEPESIIHLSNEICAVIQIKAMKVPFWKAALARILDKTVQN